MLEIKNVYKSYDGKKDAIKDISLDIENGDIFAFIGHNGAGKTTLIKCIVGLLDFEKGSIKIDGIDIKERPIDAKKILAYIPDNPNIYESMSGIKYLNFISDAFSLSSDERKEKIEYYSNFLDLNNKLGDKISTYSHGMKQKLAIIGALIHSPKLLVLDEPFVGLDPEASFKIKNVFKELTEKGTAIFFSTHVLDTAEKICNKVGIIRHGEVIKCGDMQIIKKDESLEEVFLELLGEENGQDI
ncbi:ABC transporter ATP-binding protein [bacterium]|nr:ABC transporter ATP-binding protein [bacterium]